MAAVENNSDFERRVQEYIKATNPFVCILTPCYGGVACVEYVTSLMNTMNTFQTLGINVKIEFCRNDSLVSRARNNLIAKAMNDPKVTHAMFIDNDIIWDPISIIKLLVADKAVIGGIYPLKNYFWDRLTKPNTIKNWIDAKNGSFLKNIISDDKIVQNKLLNYNLNILPGGLHISNNIGRVRHIATGFMLIKRDTLEKMFKAFPSTKYTDDISFLKPEENRFAYALFDCGVEDDHYYSEDWMFCSRWSKMGGEIWVDISIDLTHIGIERYTGSYLSQLVDADRPKEEVLRM
jgi:hypothetical protein